MREEYPERIEVMTTEEMAIDSINDSIMVAAMEHFSRKGFRWVEVPVVNSSFIAYAGQLYLETKVPAHKKVWTTLPSIESNFKMIGFEHEGGLECLASNMEELAHAMIRKILERNKRHLKRLGKRPEELEKYLYRYERITYSQAVEMLWGSPLELKWGDKPSKKQEIALVEKMGGPLFLTHLPKELGAFNTKINEKDPSVINSVFLLMPYVGRIADASEREDDYSVVAERLVANELYSCLKDERGLSEYLDMMEKNPGLHSGCGFDFTKIIDSILSTESIVDAPAF